MLKKRLISMFLCAILVLTSICFSNENSKVSAAENDAELSATTCTIVQVDGGYHYYDWVGDLDTSTGWKENSKGLYAYYVCSTGYVKYKIASGKLYKWNGDSFEKISLKSQKKKIKKLGGKYIYITKNGKVARSAGWRKNKAGSYAYYVDDTGCVTYKIKSNYLYKWNGKKWKKVKISANSKKTIGNRTFYTNASGKIKSSKKTSTSTSTSTTSTLANEVLSLVNEARAEEGLSALTSNSTLNKNAATRAEELATLFDHTRPDGTSCFTAVTITNWMSLGENIATATTANAEYVVNMWLNSTNHRANILSSTYDSIGIGVYYSDGVYYFVQIFAQTY